MNQLKKGSNLTKRAGTMKMQVVQTIDGKGMSGNVFHRFDYFTWQKIQENKDIIQQLNQTTKK